MLSINIGCVDFVATMAVDEVSGSAGRSSKRREKRAEGHAAVSSEEFMSAMTGQIKVGLVVWYEFRGGVKLRRDDSHITEMGRHHQLLRVRSGDRYEVHDTVGIRPE